MARRNLLCEAMRPMRATWKSRPPSLSSHQMLSLGGGQSGGLRKHAEERRGLPSRRKVASAGWVVVAQRTVTHIRYAQRAFPLPRRLSAAYPSGIRYTNTITNTKGSHDRCQTTLHACCRLEQQPNKSSWRCRLCAVNHAVDDPASTVQLTHHCLVAFV